MEIFVSLNLYNQCILVLAWIFEIFTEGLLVGWLRGAWFELFLRVLTKQETPNVPFLFLFLCFSANLDQIARRQNGESP